MQNLFLQYLLFMDLGAGLCFDYTTDHCYVLKSDCSVGVFNRVMNTANPSGIEVASINQFFNDIRYTWLVAADATATKDVLCKFGLSYKISFPAMSMDLAVIKQCTYGNDITVYHIQKQDIPIWIAIVARSFNLNETELAKGLYYLMNRASPDTLKLYLGYYQDIPVAASMVVMHGTIVTLHFVGTLPEYRGKGLGYAVTHKPLLDAKTNGCTQALLLSSVLGKPIYEKMNFKEYCLYDVYGN